VANPNAVAIVRVDVHEPHFPGSTSGMTPSYDPCHDRDVLSCAPRALREPTVEGEVGGRLASAGVRVRIDYQRILICLPTGLPSPKVTVITGAVATNAFPSIMPHRGMKKALRSFSRHAVEFVETSNTNAHQVSSNVLQCHRLCLASIDGRAKRCGDEPEPPLSEIKGLFGCIAKARHLGGFFPAQHAFISGDASAPRSWP
jgi:hypothetical protein